MSLQQPELGPAGLYALRTVLTEDVAVVGGSFVVEPANPAPGVPATLRVSVTNLGETPVIGGTVGFYNGDPSVGGESIGRTSVTDVLPTGARATLSVPWTLGATTLPLTLYAVVDPDQVTADRDRSNNSTTLRTVLPDLQLSDVRWSPLWAKVVSIVGRVTNNGSVPAPATVLALRRDSAAGALLYEGQVPALGLGQSSEVSFTVDTAGWPNGAVVVLLSDPTNIAEESDEMNNTASLSFSTIDRPPYTRRRRGR